MTMEAEKTFTADQIRAALTQIISGNAEMMAYLILNETPMANGMSAADVAALLADHRHHHLTGMGMEPVSEVLSRAGIEPGMVLDG